MAEHTSLSYFTTADTYDIYLPIIKRIIDSFEIIPVKNQ